MPPPRWEPNLPISQRENLPVAEPFTLEDVSYWALQTIFSTTKEVLLEYFYTSWTSVIKQRPFNKNHIDFAIRYSACLLKNKFICLLTYQCIQIYHIQNIEIYSTNNRKQKNWSNWSQTLCLELQFHFSYLTMKQC